MTNCGMYLLTSACGEVLYNKFMRHIVRFSNILKHSIIPPSVPEARTVAITALQRSNTVMQTTVIAHSITRPTRVLWVCPSPHHDRQLAIDRTLFTSYLDLLSRLALSSCSLERSLHLAAIDPPCQASAIHLHLARRHCNTTSANPRGNARKILSKPGTYTLPAVKESQIAVHASPPAPI